MIITYKDFISENKMSTPEDYGITEYEWSQGKLNCFQDVNLAGGKLKQIPFIFGKVDGNFTCYDNKLTNLYGCPEYVGGYFSCNINQITSLEYCPKIIGRHFACSDNKLTSLEYCPKTIGGNFECSKNKLKNLDHCPTKINGMFYCSYNELTSLVGCPENVDGNFYCYDNNLNSLIGCPKYVKGYFDFSDNYLKSIEDYPLCIIENDIVNEFYFNEIYELVKNNVESFKPLLDDKVKFHQMVMRLNPDLIQYYKTIPPPSKITMLLEL